jgi:Uma2 family endonuclease
MSAAIPRLAASEDEYLRRELESPEKHEYVNGEIVAMAGGTARHALICANVAGALRGLLKARPCVVLSSDQRVGISATGMYAYPDISVLCSKPVFHPKDANTLTNPVVVVEVLSGGTEFFDRGAKFAHFQRLESLQEYVLVAQETKRVEHYRRTDVGQWLLTIVEDVGQVSFPALQVALPMDEIYAKLELLEAN